MTPQQKRVESFIKDTDSRNVDELADSLHENSEAFRMIVIPAGFAPSDPGPHVLLKSILADRRVLKIHAYLTSLETRGASRKVRLLFESRFDKYVQAWTKANKTNSSVLPRHRYAMSCALFLASEFLDTQEFEAVFSKWLTWYESKKRGKSTVR